MSSRHKDIPSSRSDVVKSIAKHKVDLVVLREREQQLRGMINTLESLIPFAVVWYMWRFALAGNADPETRLNIEHEAKRRLSRLLAALEDMKEVVGPVKSQESAPARGDPGSGKRMKKVPTDTSLPSDDRKRYKQIDPTLKPGSHMLLDEPAPSKEGKEGEKPEGKSKREKGPKPASRSGTTLPSKPQNKPRSEKDGKHPKKRPKELPESSEDNLPTSQPTDQPTRSPADNLSNSRPSPTDVSQTSSGSRREPKETSKEPSDTEKRSDRTPKMAEGSKSKSRIVREVIEIQRDGKPPEKVEVQPGMDPPQIKAVEDLINKLDKERDDLLQEMDRIFGPLPETFGKSGKPDAKKVSDEKDDDDDDERDVESFDDTPEEDEWPRGKSPGRSQSPGSARDKSRPASGKSRPSPPYTENKRPQNKLPKPLPAAEGIMPLMKLQRPDSSDPYTEYPPYLRDKRDASPPLSDEMKEKMDRIEARLDRIAQAVDPGPGQGSPYGRGWVSPYGPVTPPGQGSPYGGQGPDQGGPHIQATPGQGTPYGQGAPGQGPPYGEEAPDQWSPNQDSPYGQGAPYSPKSARLQMDQAPPGASPEEMKEGIERIEARLDKIAQAVENSMKGSSAKQDSTDSTDSADSDEVPEEFYKELKRIQDQIAEGMQKIQSIIDREMMRAHG